MIQALLHISVFNFVLLSLAAFRVTRLITQDTLPLFARPRNWLWSKFPPSGMFMDGGPADHPPHVKHAVYQNSGRGTDSRWFIESGHWLGDLTSCAWCIGWWTCVTGAAIFGLWPTFAVVASIPFALSSVVGLLSTHQG